jgi:hypothetical protein
MARLIELDVRANLLTASQILPAATLSWRWLSGVLAASAELSGVPAMDNLNLIAWTYAFLLVREAERLRLEFPAEEKPLSEWLRTVFVPALVKSFTL